MYSKSEKYYDNIYASIGKDYPAEANKARKFIQKYKQSKGNRLLDVGCGTGVHANLLSKHYQVEGLDIDPKMLAVARKKYPKIRFQQGDMVHFKLKSKFDIIVCLFSAIGYVKTKSHLQKTIKNMCQHLFPGGVLLVEPWFTPNQWHPGRVFTTQVNKADLKIVRMSHSSQRGNISIIEFQYLIGTPKGIERDTEFLELGLFTKKEYLDTFRSAGLKVIHDLYGLDGRGLYIGIKPLDKK
ncbi:MAG: class I SAM-dependent methyltransferase [Anaerolineales bacterium]|nr:class I SAM-dependent methyltransferase [Anaerolineales bacterium]